MEWFLALAAFVIAFGLGRWFIMQGGSANTPVAAPPKPKPKPFPMPPKPQPKPVPPTPREEL